MSAEANPFDLNVMRKKWLKELSEGKYPRKLDVTPDTNSCSICGLMVNNILLPEKVVLCVKSKCLETYLLKMVQDLPPGTLPKLTCHVTNVLVIQGTDSEVLKLQTDVPGIVLTILLTDKTYQEALLALGIDINRTAIEVVVVPSN